MSLDNGKVNILIVDDRPEGLVAVEAVLSKVNYNLVRAYSGKEALGKVLKYDFAVILMDVQMPEMDGFETVRIIKQREKSKDIPVIFLTAISKEEHHFQRGYESGAVDYLCKPFDPIALISKVNIFAELYKKNKKIKEQAEQIQVAEQRERMRQLGALQMESLNRYRHLADAIPHIIWKLRSDGSLEYSNHLWSAFSGLSFDQSSGTGWQSAIHLEDLEILLNKINAAKNESNSFEAECRLLQSSDQTFRWHILRGVPEFRSPGEVSAWIVTNTDIEDRKKMENALIQAKEESLSANEAKSAFLANMSHEIRTPLGIVIGFAELLAATDISDTDKRNYLDTIRRNGALLLSLIGDILDLSKIEAGHLQIEKTNFNLQDFLRTMSFSVQQQAEAKGIQVRTILDGPIPMNIWSDPMRLRQVFLNVVGNAIKFTEKGEVSIRVKLDQTDDQAEGSLKILVTDQGIGITPAQAKKLFQPFIQADPSNIRKYGGTGLGLSLSRNLAKKLGGDVILESSEPGKGSTFVIQISTGPLNKTEMINTLIPAGVTRAQDIEVEAVNLKGMRVLVVDDAIENQILLSTFLNRAGAEVHVADNGQDGVRKALEEDVDIVLMDIQMPILDGYQATRKLRSQAFQKPILALTAYALKEEYERSLAAGCDDHLTKPINRRDLLKHVSKFVKKPPEAGSLVEISNAPGKSVPEMAPSLASE